MTKKKDVYMWFGTLISIEDQLNSQGYTLGEHVDEIQEAFDALANLVIDGYMYYNDYSKVFDRMKRRVFKLMKPMEVQR